MNLSSLFFVFFLPTRGVTLKRWARNTARKPLFGGVTVKPQLSSLRRTDGRTTPPCDEGVEEGLDAAEGRALLLHVLGTGQGGGGVKGLGGVKRLGRVGGFG